ncbi:hypothetical protein T4A_7315 [Trichinella pseudospiralis]|uniref:Uncharacterized protein n=1 Tax=Trichinella pseudospiralis TaxID=6337 RepID=A0A0V1DU61_TRIPS|nr:hypothetical protein T4A_7315 [Trichinella pseudospiralis]KRY81660.1 hypothetical protein T4D_15094 [Trichinella pseudospiralis]KRZ30886.1 hypothetical protein T4C_12408 [Trichinella pseudospiralis]
MEKPSDCIIFGYPRRKSNQFKACMNLSADKSDNSFKCMARVTIQVNREMYTFVHPSSRSMCNDVFAETSSTYPFGHLILNL